MTSVTIKRKQNYEWIGREWLTKQPTNKEGCNEEQTNKLMNTVKIQKQHHENKKFDKQTSQPVQCEHEIYATNEHCGNIVQIIWLVQNYKQTNKPMHRERIIKKPSNGTLREPTNTFGGNTKLTNQILFWAKLVQLTKSLNIQNFDPQKMHTDKSTSFSWNCPF